MMRDYIAETTCEKKAFQLLLLCNKSMLHNSIIFCLKVFNDTLILKHSNHYVYEFKLSDTISSSHD